MMMQDVIRHYRKKKGMTQQEMAVCLGVSASAVNKWESGSSYPDILMLKPLARLLDISLDTLLSFRRELSMEQIDHIVQQAQQQLKESSYAEAFQWMKRQVAQYPNCDWLIWQLAALFDAHRFQETSLPPEADDTFFIQLYTRVMNGEDPGLRQQAADSLFYLHLRQNRLDQAQSLLNNMPSGVEKKRRQALICQRRGQREEAMKLQEEILFSEYQSVNLVLNDLRLIAMECQDHERVRRLSALQSQLARCFEMGPYYEAAAQLELAVWEKDEAQMIRIAEALLEGVKQMDSFCHSWLYRHMTFKPVPPGWVEEMRENLLEGFRKDPDYAPMLRNEAWQTWLAAQQEEKKTAEK